MKYLNKLNSIFLLIAISSSAYADHDEYRTSINFLISSDHYYKDTKDYNEDHNGIGVSFTNRESDVTHSFMTYTNSLYQESLAYTVSGPIGCNRYKMCVGVALVAATNYNDEYPFGLAVAPFLTLSWGVFHSMHFPGVVSGYGLSIPVEK